MYCSAVRNYVTITQTKTICYDKPHVLRPTVPMLAVFNTFTRASAENATRSRVTIFLGRLRSARETQYAVHFKHLVRAAVTTREGEWKKLEK